MKEKKQISRVEEVLTLLDKQDFSTIPSVLAQLLRISADPRADACDLAELCEKDIATSARVLRTANSIYFASRYQERARTLKDAIVRIGFRHAQEIIISAIVRIAMLAHHSVMDYSTTGLWKHSIAVGIGDRLLHTKKRGSYRVLDPFLVGLMHDMGIAVEHQVMFQNGFSDAIHERYLKGTPLIEEEKKILGFTHEELGMAVAKRWNFPYHLVEAIGHHHTCTSNEETAQYLFHINRISEWICFSLNIGYSDFSKPYIDELAQSQDALQLKKEEIEEVASKLHFEMETLTHIGWFTDYRVRAA